MSNIKKLMMSAAGGDALNVEDVFDVHLFSPNTSGDYTVTNNIDLNGEGGLVWMKNRINTSPTVPLLHDTERWGASNGGYLRSDVDNGAASTAYFTSFNSDGFTAKDMNNEDMVSWTFRKCPKFFDAVEYSGNNENGQYVNHNLGVTPGMIILKSTSSAGKWYVWHRGLSSTSYALRLHTTASQSIDTNYEIGINASATQFYVDTGSEINYGGASDKYIAYLFAHNNGDGEFGPTGDQDIIKCGSYSGNGSTQKIDLGFEPQWLMIKKYSGSGDEGWIILDNMRGFHAHGATHDDRPLFANSSTQESSINNLAGPLPDGFFLERGDGAVNASGSSYIYVAIRRPQGVPTSASEVFNHLEFTGNDSTSRELNYGFPVDFFSGVRLIGDGFVFCDKLRGPDRQLYPVDTYTEATGTDYCQFDSMDGPIIGYNSSGANINSSAYSYYSFGLKRAPNFFDMVAYEGTGTSGYQAIDHNLGVVPEMIWFKNRDSTNVTDRGHWYVYHKDLANSNGYLWMDTASAEATDYPGWTTSSFPFSDTLIRVNKTRLAYSGESYIAYLFASLSGIAKVGSFTGNGSSQNIDCGFSSGARFVMVRALDSTGHWFVWNSESGIVSGNDPYLRFNLSNAEETSRDLIDPYSAGFRINYSSDLGNQLNGSGYTYLFYAIA